MNVLVSFQVYSSNTALLYAHTLILEDVFTLFSNPLHMPLNKVSSYTPLTLLSL